MIMPLMLATKMLLLMITPKTITTSSCITNIVDLVFFFSFSRNFAP